MRPGTDTPNITYERGRGMRKAAAMTVEGVLDISDRTDPTNSLSSHLPLNREGRWDTADDFATSFLHFSLFSTALCDLANSRPVHFLMLSSHLFLCLVFFPLSQCLAIWVWLDIMNGRHDHTTAVCVSLRRSGGLPMVRLPAGSWHRLPHW